MHSSALFTDAGGGNTDALLYMFGTLYTQQMEVLFFIPFVNVRLHNNKNLDADGRNCTYDDKHYGFAPLRFFLLKIKSSI